MNTNKGEKKEDEKVVVHKEGDKIFTTSDVLKNQTSEDPYGKLGRMDINSFLGRKSKKQSSSSNSDSVIERDMDADRPHAGVFHKKRSHKKDDPII